MLDKAKTLRLTDFDELKETVINCSTVRKKKVVAFKVEEAENALLSSFI